MDGVVDSKMNKVGIGIVLGDSGGRAAMAKPIGQLLSSLMIELFAIRKAIDFCRDVDMQ